MRNSSISLNFLLILNLLTLSNLSYSEISSDHLMSLETAAIDGNINAQSQLASMYYLGEGVEQNFNQAFAWYQLAAEQGDAKAQYSLGNLYLLGEGTQIDKKQAMYWYQKSSEQGFTRAQSRLNTLSASLKLGSNLDLSTETNHYAGAPLEEEKDIVILKSQDEIEIKRKTPSNNNNSDNLFDQLFNSNPENNEKVDIKEVSEDKDNLINTDSATSDLQPGPIINHEVIKEKTKEKIFEPITQEHTYLYQLYNKAKENDADAQYLIGNAYYTGNEIEQNLQQAFLWYQRAAENGHIDAQFQLANIYLMGEGIHQNDEKALFWYKKAAEQNHPDAKKNYESLKQFSITKDTSK